MVGWFVGCSVVSWPVGWLVGWLVCWFIGWLASWPGWLALLAHLLSLLGLLNLQGNLFRNVGEKICKEISLENVEVEHDFSGGLSKRVTLKFSWQPPNLTRIGNPYDFAIAS